MRVFTSVLVFGTLLMSNATSAQIQTTLASLRTITASITEPYFITDAGREGLFYYDASDRSTADNGGTVIVNQSSKRFKRAYSGAIDVRWFGAKGDYNGTTGTDNAPAINAAMAAAKKFETVMIPDGQFRIFSNISLPLTTTKRIKFEIYGDVYFSKGYGFIIEGAYQDFRSYGLICGMNSGATTESAYSAYVGTGIYLKNAVNCRVEVNEIKDFKYGIHLGAEGANVGCQYNNIYFNSIHHNFVQIRIATIGSVSPVNWNNASHWFGGQLGRGPIGTYGGGGTYGISFVKDAGSNAGAMSGHMFYNIGFEGLDKGLLMANTEYTTFSTIRVEPFNVRVPFDLDPVTAGSTKFVGAAYIDETFFATNRLGNNTTISGTPIWAGTSSSKAYMGHEASASVTPNKLLVTTSKYAYTNFMVNKLNDLISQTGQYPTVQAMMYRINGTIRSVGFKKTFFNAKASVTGSPLTLPPNIGMVRVQTNQAKVFKIDTGDLAMYGEEFLVEYLTPQYPISFVRSDNGAVLIPATAFPSGGTYRCMWVDAAYVVSKIGAEYKTQTQTGPNWTVADGTETHYVNYPNTATATLPPAAAWPGRVIIIKNLQAGFNVQVVGVSASDESILQGRGSMTVKSDGTTWNIIAMYKRNLTY
ncbi:MAG: hypothetical protein J7497_02185 [Chitinophagaceae bacterium]|nr:hypothetical protein [Chitinophagaceae bacterium]